MAIPNERSLKRPRVIEERFESDDSEIESEEDEEVEHGDDLDDIKQEIDDWNDSWDDVEMNKDDYLEEVDDKSEIKCLEEISNGAGNGILTKDESSDEEEHFGDVESDDEKPPIKDPDIKKKTKKKVAFVEPEASSESDSESSSSDIEEDDEDDYDGDGDDEGEEGEKKVGKMGLANVMSKILRTRKKGGEILSKAKKDYELEDKDNAFQVVDDKGKIKKMVKEEEEEAVTLGPHMRHILREKWLKQFRKMPNVVDDREYERKFKMIATQGVVQLFSAITKHKTLVEKENKEQKSVVARELLLEKTEKSSFLKVLQKEGKKVAKIVEEVEIKKEEKEDEVPEKKPRWSALSKDFYQEPSLKGWDQQSDDD